MFKVEVVVTEESSKQLAEFANKLNESAESREQVGSCPESRAFRAAARAVREAAEELASIGI